MRLLLDTHILLWAISDADRLSPETRAAIADPENEVLFSAASIWEIAIKLAVGRLEARVGVAEIASEAIGNGFRELPVVSSVAARVAELPLHHRDPFDRLLLAQAMAEPAILYTRDAALERYSDLVKRV